MSDVLSAEARHHKRLEQELISQGRCPYCGWRTGVSGRGQVCGSCVRDAVATRLAAAEACAEQLRAERDAATRNERHMRNLHDWRVRDLEAAHAEVGMARNQRDAEQADVEFRPHAHLSREFLENVYMGALDTIVGLEAAARAGGCAADALREIAKMAGPGESGTGAAGWILTLQAPRIARDALARFDRAVSGQTAEKEEARQERG